VTGLPTGGLPAGPFQPRLRWIIAAAVAVPIVAVTWISFNVLVAFAALVIGVPAALLLGTVLWVAAALGKAATVRQVGQGLVLGALLGFVGGFVSCFAVASLGGRTF
jgi:tetrahydromethanopterin S-methyltransferase subunit E